MSVPQRNLWVLRDGLHDADDAVSGRTDVGMCRWLENVIQQTIDYTPRIVLLLDSH